MKRETPSGTEFCTSQYPPLDLGLDKIALIKLGRGSGFAGAGDGELIRHYPDRGRDMLRNLMRNCCLNEALMQTSQNGSRCINLEL